MHVDVERSGSMKGKGCEVLGRHKKGFRKHRDLLEDRHAFSFPPPPAPLSGPKLDPCSPKVARAVHRTLPHPPSLPRLPLLLLVERLSANRSCAVGGCLLSLAYRDWRDGKVFHFSHIAMLESEPWLRGGRSASSLQNSPFRGWGGTSMAPQLAGR